MNTGKKISSQDEGGSSQAPADGFQEKMQKSFQSGKRALLIGACGLGILVCIAGAWVALPAAGSVALSLAAGSAPTVAAVSNAAVGGLVAAGGGAVAVESYKNIPPDPYASPAPVTSKDTAVVPDRTFDQRSPGEAFAFGGGR